MSEEHGVRLGRGRYEVRQRIGEGTSGIVFEAWDHERKMLVALKTLAKLDAHALYLLKQEFRKLSGLSHPNLVRLYDLVSEGSTAFFTMELVDGVSFVDAHRRVAMTTRRSAADGTDRGSAPPSSNGYDETKLRASLAQLGAALQAVHQAGLVHRDVKPSNVLVTTQGRVVLLDFGIAQDVRARSEGGIGIEGTPAYMAPEQVAVEPLGPPADWYGVGAILYEVLTGVPPFEGDAMTQLTAKLQREPAPPHARGVVVPADLEELCMGLLRMTPTERLGGRAFVERVGGSGVFRASEDLGESSSDEAVVPGSAIVGRERARGELLRAFASVKDQQPVVALVEGTSGMGKSALVRSVLDELTYRGEAVVLEGRCFERESVPYKGVDSVMDALSHKLVELDDGAQRELVPKDVAALVRLFPVLERVPAFAGSTWHLGESYDAHQVRKRAFSALRELFRGLTARRRVVVFIDDAQWGDLDSAVLLRDLTAPPDPPGLLLILAYRQEEKGRSLALQALLDPLSGVAPRLDATLVPVGPLSFDDARILAARMLPDAPGSAQLAAAIARESQGNPFFVGELVHYVAARGAALDGVHLDEMLGERIRRLPEAPRRLLEAVAVAARPTRLAIVVRAAGLSGEEGFAAVETLRGASLLRGAGSRARDRVECFHDRVREAAVACLPPEELPKVHERLASALVAAGEADPERLFGHYFGAGQLARAAEHAITSGRRAARAFAFDRASRLLRAALDLCPPEDDRHHGLTIELADALTNAGRGAEAAEVYVQAALSASSPTEALFLRRRAAEELLFSGHVDRGRAALSEVLSAHGLALPKSRLRAVLAVLALRLLLTIRGLSFRQRDVESIAPASLMRLDLLVSTATGLVMVDTLLGAPFATGNVIEALRVGEPWRVCRAVVVEACFQCTAGGTKNARLERLLGRADAVASSLKRLDTSSLVLATRGTAHYFRGEWKNAQALLERGLAGYEEFVEPMAGARTITGYNFSARWEMSTFRYFNLVALTHLGRLDELTDRLLVYQRDAEERGDLSSLTNYLVGEPNLLWLARDNGERMRRSIDDVMRRWSRSSFLRQHWLELLALSQLDLYTGDGPAALARLEAAWAPLRRSLLLRIQYFRIRALHVRARAAVAAASLAPRADELLRRAEADVRSVRKEAMAWATPLADVVVAAVAHQRGDDAAARRLLDGAARALDAADMPLWALAARRRTAELAGDDGAVRATDEAFERAGVRRPTRYVAMAAPGFRTGGS